MLVRLLKELVQVRLSSSLALLLYSPLPSELRLSSRIKEVFATTQIASTLHTAPIHPFTHTFILMAEAALNEATIRNEFTHR